MRINSRIFIDGADPKETALADVILKSAGLPGVEGQTTNPSLIAKSAAESLTQSRKLSPSQAEAAYKKTVREIAQFTAGPISIQITGNSNQNSFDMLMQARSRYGWTKQSVIKFPCTSAGLEAAEQFCREGPVNITLVFTQEQAAAVYTATVSSKFPVYASPFVGRLDDGHENGMEIVSNILKMYKSEGDNHVEVITSSVRTLDHLLYALKLGSPVITIPFKVLLAWKENKFILPDAGYSYRVPLPSIPYRQVALGRSWRDYDLNHPLTAAGVDKFWSDWTAVVEIQSVCS